MAHVVCTDGSFTCADTGVRTLTSAAKLCVGGCAVVPFSAAAGAGTYQDCTFASGSVTGPCTATTVVSGGKASKLTVDGDAVLLDDLSATAGTPPPPKTISVAAGQTQLTAT